MEKHVTISPSGWKIMRRLWASAPMTITQLVASLRDETGWSKATVISTLNRLEERGAVYFQQEPGERARRYYPAITEEEAAAQETEEFLSKVYQGRFGLMISAMAQAETFTPEDIKEMERILDQMR